MLSCFATNSKNIELFCTQFNTCVLTVCTYSLTLVSKTNYFLEFEILGK
jgi:hypothetical protein